MGMREVTEHCLGCGWFVTGQSSHKVTDVAEPGKKQSHKTLGEQIDLFRK